MSGCLYKAIRILPTKAKYNPFLVRWGNWEYWPPYLSNIPIVFYWFLYALRSRSLLFFTNVNPSIPTGGLFGESKSNILKLIPENHLPGYLLVRSPGKLPLNRLINLMEAQKIIFPCIVKPDVGERGRGVVKINNPRELQNYHQNQSVPYIIQEYLDLPLEFSILCYSIPGSDKQGITSVCQKEFLHVAGNGKSTLRELIEENPRALLQKERLEKAWGNDLLRIPSPDEEVLLEPIGNHCRGTKFLNRNDLISPALEQIFLPVLDKMEGVAYGRFDLRTQSINDLLQHGEFKVMEFNGVGSEPAHVYDPSYSMLRAYRDFKSHWKLLFEIHMAQKRRGNAVMTFRALRREWKTYRNLTRQSDFPQELVAL